MFISEVFLVRQDTVWAEMMTEQFRRGGVFHGPLLPLQISHGFVNTNKNKYLPV